jgi:hypothetical protein
MFSPPGPKNKGNDSGSAKRHHAEFAGRMQSGRPESGGDGLYREIERSWGYGGCRPVQERRPQADVGVVFLVSETRAFLEIESS